MDIKHINNNGDDKMKRKENYDSKETIEELEKKIEELEVNAKILMQQANELYQNTLTNQYKINKIKETLRRM